MGALFLSVVPSYAAELLHTSDLALLGAISATMLAMACFAQTVCLRGAMTPARAQPLGLATVISGIVALVLAFPLHSLALVLCAAVLAGGGLGLSYFGAQTEVNQLAPPEQRGEVTAAFITSVYAAVTVVAVGTGLLSDAFTLATAVAITRHQCRARGGDHGRVAPARAIAATIRLDQAALTGLASRPGGLSGEGLQEGPGARRTVAT